MASKSFSEEDFSCPVCYNIYKDPVILTCTHSICNTCLQKFWETKGSRECPVCRTRCSKEEYPLNLVLKNLCETFQQREENSQREPFCSLHRSELKLFCEDDKQLVCLVCRDSKLHKNHNFSPIGEAALERKEELKIKLEPLKKKLDNFKQVKTSSHKTAQHIRVQAQHTERQIKKKFKKLHQFLQDEEAARLAALREEEELKSQLMHPRLYLSEDLTSVRLLDGWQQLPDNLERLAMSLWVVGSESFNSGTHCWDVEVGDSDYWILGVKTESSQKKGVHFSGGNWGVVCYFDEYKARSSSHPDILLTVEEEPQMIRVQLDWDRGELSFTDPDNNTHLHTFTHTFTERVFPYFITDSYLRILPVKAAVTVEQLS
ncbi:nuclear factor 7, brain-like [Clupea harengus]|uniref:Nuclear factor 7, brain-like n=1 Tax=Clupea harengus TaxID=7950 RepID=A0A8M1KE54_CLUHA|nr:nuclear factor 7, brain-like [Clupea harengus]